MGKYAIIATRHSEENCNNTSLTVGKLNHDLTNSGYDVRFMRNCNSIFEAYEQGFLEIKPKDTDIIILCHDDIEILNTSQAFNDIITKYLGMSKVGFLGVAGSRVMFNNYNWLRCGRQIPDGCRGSIFHGKNNLEMEFTHFGNCDKALVMDGVFLVTTGKILRKIQLKKPKSFVGGWHWYDAFYTLQAALKGFTNYVIPVSLRHESGGDYNTLFFEDMKRFHELFKDKLPIVL